MTKQTNMTWTVLDAFSTAGAARSCAECEELKERSTESVDKLISDMGYIVRCGIDTEYYSIDGSIRFVRSYVIISIRRGTGEYVYGAGSAIPLSGSHVEAWPLLRTTSRRGISISEVRTIGKILPSDIAVALEEYQFGDPLPAWEFGHVIETCPVAEKEEYDQDDDCRNNGAVGPTGGIMRNNNSDSSSDDD